MAAEKIKDILAKDKDGRDILKNGLDDSYVSLGTFYHILRSDDLKENEDVQRYLTNMIFNLSSGTGWDVQKDEVEFIYSKTEELVHPLDVYVPVNYALERLEGCVNFSVNISETLRRNREDRFGRKGPSLFDAISGGLSRLFGRQAAPEPQPVSTAKERLYDVMAEAVISAQHDMYRKDRLLADGNFAYYNPRSGAQNPLFLSAQEKGTTFDFVMRRKP